MSNKLSNKEVKGTRDWLPDEFLIRSYIFNTWRKVCQSYGFEEYLTPIVENSGIYRAKSGEDVGGKELVSFTDPGGRDLSIRPEMTPSVTRLITKIYNETPKPIKFFSIANFMRNEKPQKGRNREFWQLNVDTFGSDSLSADIEIMQLSLDLMLEFKAPRESFSLGISNRKLIEGVLKIVGADELKLESKLMLVRTLDKWNKLSVKDIEERLTKLNIRKSDIKIISTFMSTSNIDELLSKIPQLVGNKGLEEVGEAINILNNRGYNGLFKFDPSIIRGFDYYDGLVFEMHDNSEENKRSLFGGGRYNGLAELFGFKNFPAVGIAPGDETMKIFLETWDLLGPAYNSKKVIYYLPLLDDGLSLEINRLAISLRKNNKNILLGLQKQKINKALEFANKKKIEKIIILGGDEYQKGIYKVKDMTTGKEKIEKINKK